VIGGCVIGSSLALWRLSIIVQIMSVKIS